MVQPALFQNEKVLINTCRNGHLEIVKILVKIGAYIHTQKGEALINASEKVHLDIVQYLVENRADISSNEYASLKKAAINKHDEIVRFFIKKGVKKGNEFYFVLNFYILLVSIKRPIIYALKL